MIVYLERHGGSIVSLDDIERKHGKRGIKKFMEWMHGQTMPIVPKKDIVAAIPKSDQWVYWDDYRRWVYGLPIID